MQKTLTALALILALGACGNHEAKPHADTKEVVAVTPAEIEAETARLNEWFEARYEEELAFSPIQLTFLGRKEQYDKIDDFSDAAQDAQLEWKRQTVEEMKKNFDYNKLTQEAQSSYDIWAYQYELAAEGAKYRGDNYIFEQMGGPQSQMPTFLINFHRVDDESDMLAYISRISAVAEGMNELVSQAKANAANGVRPPKFAYDGVIDQATKVITGAPFTDGPDSSLWADIKTEISQLNTKGVIDEERMSELEALAKAAMLTDFGPAYQNLIDFMQEDLPNADVIATGVGKLPDGKNFYNYRLKASTTTTMTADEVHAIGLAEVARLRGEMEAIKDSVGFEGDLQEFFAFIRDSKDDPRFYYPNNDEGRQAYLDDATAAIENIKRELPNYFGILPKADVIVKRVEPFREQPGAAQHYYPGTPDGSRDGIYYAHLIDMTTMPKNQLEVIAYHEALPGHHMQISIAQESESVPMFRTQAGFTAYIEGWALYSELLAKEMPNTYQDPYSDFGRLTTEIWRAIRLVVDTGLHSKGWTEQEAIDYFSANTPAPLDTVQSEVRRYIVWPGQATAYKIGMLDIMKLRAKAESELGDKFDIKGFHDTILGGGALPLAILERRVDQWIASQKA